MKTFTTILMFLSLTALAVNSTTHTVDFTVNELEDDVLELFNGDALIIKFHERPSTGFVW
jgi:predicted secreted protein